MTVAAERARVMLHGDDDEALQVLARALVGEGLTAQIAVHGATAATIDAARLHLALAPRGLVEGSARLRELRQQAGDAPLIVACRAGVDLDHVLALELGADDVVDIEWSPAVIAARLRAWWRRLQRRAAPRPADATELVFGNLRLHLHARRVELAGRIVPLSEGEFEVLWLLASHAGHALSRRDILRRVRGLADAPMDRSIDSRVYRIRIKLGDNDSRQQRIRAVRNHGYVFSPLGW